GTAYSCPQRPDSRRTLLARAHHERGRRCRAEQRAVISRSFRPAGLGSTTTPAWSMPACPSATATTRGCASRCGSSPRLGCSRLKASTYPAHEVDERVGEEPSQDDGHKGEKGCILPAVFCIRQKDFMVSGITLLGPRTD